MRAGSKDTQVNEQWAITSLHPKLIFKFIHSNSLNITWLSLAEQKILL